MYLCVNYYASSFGKKTILSAELYFDLLHYDAVASPQSFSY